MPWVTIGRRTIWQPDAPRRRPSRASTPDAVLNTPSIAPIAAPTPTTATTTRRRTSQQRTADQESEGNALDARRRRPAPRVRRVINRVAQIAESEVPGSGPTARRIARAAIRASRRTGVPASLLVGLTGQESAYGTNTGPSSAGARSETQFIEGTRNYMIEKYGVDPWAGTQQALRAAALYLKELGVQENPSQALTRYSGGYAESEYNNPVLRRAERFAQTGIDKLARSKAPVPPVRKGPPARAVRRWVDVEPDDNFRGLHPLLQRRLVQIGRRSGQPVDTNSLYRTYEEQAALYANRASNPYPVAPPGSSRHESGLAFDANLTPEQERIARELGLVQPMPDTDPVHWELEGVEPRPATRGGGGGYLGGTSGGGTGGGGAGGSGDDALLEELLLGRRGRGGGSGGGLGLGASTSAPLPDAFLELRGRAADEEDEDDALLELLIGDRFRPRRRLAR